MAGRRNFAVIHSFIHSASSRAVCCARSLPSSAAISTISSKSSSRIVSRPIAALQFTLGERATALPNRPPPPQIRPQLLVPVMYGIPNIRSRRVCYRAAGGPRETLSQAVAPADCKEVPVDRPILPRDRLLQGAPVGDPSRQGEPFGLDAGQAGGGARRRGQRLLRLPRARSSAPRHRTRGTRESRPGATGSTTPRR